MSDSEPQSMVENLLAEALVREPGFDAASLARLCGEHPQLAAELRSSFAALRQADQLLSGIANGDRDAMPLTNIPYEDKGVVGSGGMGIVRHVYDPHLRRDLALKVLRAAHAGDQRACSRFLAEAQVTSQLDHPGIVPVHNVSVDADGRPFFTMKLVRGQTLASVCDAVMAGKDGWTVARAVTVLLRVCEAVDYAHGKGVVHRDLKPGNIMVGSFGEVFVMDWGLARIGDEAGSELHSVRRDIASDLPESPLLTANGDVVGTPYYMAPEQALGQVEMVGPRADIYALGAILYHLLAGEPPYRRAAGSDSAMVRRLLQAGPPEPVDRITSEAHPELVAICARAMARLPSARYASVGALRADLSAWLEGRVVAAYERGWLAGLRKWARRNRALASLAALLVVAVPVIAGLWSFGVAQSQQARRARVLRHREALSEAQRTAVTLYPAWPESVPALEAWVRDRAVPLEGALPEVERVLAELLPEVRAGNHMATFLSDAYDRLRRDLRAFQEPQTGLAADVRRRVAWAAELQRRSIDEHRALWDEARAALARADGLTASVLYRSAPISLVPEFDLVPIGMNPMTKLWEFQHLPTAGGQLDKPEHDAQGHIAVGPETGVIFVLVPGGRFVMGASLDPASPHYDALAEPNEQPPHEVVLQPFYIARHELTMLQWYRLDGDYDPRAVEAATRPITLITWDECSERLARHRLRLPTEAQWEYAARAGTTTRYWSGDDLASLQGVANLADQSARRAGNWWPGLEESFDDGFQVVAHIDELDANAFGLHHVHGNAAEWVRDALTGYEAPARPGDGLRSHQTNSMYVSRGGSYAMPARRTRVSFRGALLGSTGISGVGLRASRSLGNASPPEAAVTDKIVVWPTNGHHYGSIGGAYTWDQARADAETRLIAGVRGHLVTITSEAENDFVTDNLSTADTWLGAYQDTTSRDYSEPAGGWTWVTGEPFAFTAWGGRNTPEPSNVYLGGFGEVPIGHSEEAIQYWRVQPTRWNDVPRHPDVRLPYIIEFDTGPRR